MADFTTVFVSGKIYWSKVFNPVMNYEGTGKEWSLDFVPDDVTFLKEHKLLDRLKENDSVPGDFIKLRKPEETKEGEKNDPIRIYDENNRSEEHTSELQSLMRISYAVFCLKKKTKYILT